MANLEAIIAEKSQQDNQWRAEMQADRENTIAMQDAGVEEITSSPELYVKYLDMQGDNPTYSAGNIALVMFQDPEATVFGTAERWKTLNRGEARESKFLPGIPWAGGIASRTPMTSARPRGVT